ncbi:hypothetical protein HAX54_008525 [Datura stramonium]|uniref:Uncharacterized protein n=1 Tax=Datura stramonium TaxID=4076 RepID=A0ABS8TF80_DATST|nr:hypothetical protein [Datura stramonium]
MFRFLEGTSNILQSEAEIIEGFISALGIREKEVGEGSPSAEEAPPVVASPKLDRTPTLPDVGVPEPLAPSGLAEGTSSPPDDD